MKNIFYILILIITVSCAVKKTLTLNSDEIERIEVYKGFPGTEIQMKNGFEKEFISELLKSTELPPTKYAKTHRFLIYYKNKNIDTIYTNGTIQNYKGWYKSEVNLIEKYASENIQFSDTIQGQLKTAEKLKLLMSEKRYSESVLLFSKEQQKNIEEIQKDKEMFKYWCLVWTLDDAKYERYTNRIKSGKGDFVFEENEWRIDEK